MNEAYDMSSSPLVEANTVSTFTPSEIKAIRLDNNLTQNLLAKVLCVSNKTVEAWESGTYKPAGPACRLLKLMSKNAISLASFR